MAQFFTMRFAFFFPERSKGIFWSGPYQVRAKSVTEAKDILTDAILKARRVEDSPLHDIRLLEVENRMKPGRAEEHYPSISIGVKDEIWHREMDTLYPDGLTKYRDIDAPWAC